EGWPRAIIALSGRIMQEIRQRVAENFARQGLMRTLGAALELVEDGEVHISMPFSSQLSQQLGYVHAGAVTSIVDSACGYAGLTRAPAGHDIVTAEFKTKDRKSTRLNSSHVKISYA